MGQPKKKVNSNISTHCPTLQPIEKQAMIFQMNKFSLEGNIFYKSNKNKTTTIEGALTCPNKWRKRIFPLSASDIKIRERHSNLITRTYQKILIPIMPPNPPIILFTKLNLWEDRKDIKDQMFFMDEKTVSPI